MKYDAKILTIVNSIISSILWLLGILTLLSNILDFWVLWHLSGFGFIFWAPLNLVSSIVAICNSYKVIEKKYLIANLCSLVISILFVIFTITVSSTWF